MKRVLAVWAGLWCVLSCCNLAEADDIMKNPPPLKYDWNKHSPLKWGYNDLDGDGTADTLLTVWNGKVVAFVSDDGKLPWPAKDEGQDWSAYFNKAFNAGQEPPVTWNEMRAKWGNYTILVDRDGSGRFDTLASFYYKALDLNGDGVPEAEYYHLFPGQWSNKLHVDLDGQREMTNLNWKDFCYGDEQRYLAGGKYVMNVHGNGFFVNSYSSRIQNAWENPIAWYDFDFDGRTNMVMRAADTHMEGPEGSRAYRGDLSEFEIAFELNGNTSAERFHSLDMQLTFYQYQGRGPSYQDYVDKVPRLEGLKAAAFLSEKMLSTRHETIRRYIPYMDGFKIATDFAGWKGVWMLFDEDDDDCRWEEMFSRHEPDWKAYSDHLGDRVEDDTDYSGKGVLYVGRFDGRIHLYKAKVAFWDIDYLGLYKGSCDRAATNEGPEPPAGLRYQRVRYSDTNGNGFIDKIEYMTVEYGREEETAKVERTVSLLDFSEKTDKGDKAEKAPDVCELIDPRVEAKVSGWRIEKWNGRPLTAKDFEGTPNKMVYDKMMALYAKVGDDMWYSASKLHSLAKRHGLNVSEGKDAGLKVAYTKDELTRLKEYTVPEGYSRHLSGKTRREKYSNGFWLREKVFADILNHSGLDKFTLQKLYYTGRIDELCDYVDKGLKH